MGASMRQLRKPLAEKAPSSYLRIELPWNQVRRKDEDYLFKERAKSSDSS
jgi:hypothetical protein